MSSKHDLKLFESNCKKKLKLILKSNQQRDVFKFELFYFLFVNAIEISISSSNQTWISNRKMNRTCMMLFSFQNKMKKCVTALKIKLKSLLSSDQKNKIIKLLYQYRHLNSVNLFDLSEIDFIIHRVKLISETKFHFVDQKKWFSHKKWWLRKLIQNDITENVYEKTSFIDERLSS